MSGETDLATLLKSMHPILQDGEYIFCSISYQDSDWSRLDPICFVREDEGLSLVLKRERADHENIPYSSVFRMITLSIHSSLDAVGFLAAITSQLAQHGISVNPISGYYHDHLFVPALWASDVIELLKEFSMHQTSMNQTSMNQTLYRLTAFTTTPDGGNPAGVWIGDQLPDPKTMQRIAAEVGFSETAFVAPTVGPDRTVRYYSPEAEVSFCGHATIATGVVLGETTGEGTYQLTTAVGLVPVTVHQQDGCFEAALTSVEPSYTPASDALVSEALSALGWTQAELDGSIPPARAYAGAWHLVLAVADAQRLADLNYDFETLKALMLRDGLTTLQLVWRESAAVFHARNPFPVGGIVEDPATGAAAAALGGYLRGAELVPVPTTLLIRQGEAMGRPSQLGVYIPVSGGIVVTGQAIRIE